MNKLKYERYKLRYERYGQNTTSVIQQLPPWMLLAVGGLLLVDIMFFDALRIDIAASFTGGVDFAAHFGGFLGGMIAHWVQHSPSTGVHSGYSTGDGRRAVGGKRYRAPRVPAFPILATSCLCRGRRMISWPHPRRMYPSVFKERRPHLPLRWSSSNAVAHRCQLIPLQAFRW